MDVIVILDAQTTITAIVDYARARNAEFVVLRDGAGDDLFAFRVSEVLTAGTMHGPELPAVQALGLESWKRSPAVLDASALRPMLLADPRAPSTLRYVLVNDAGVPVGVDEPPWARRRRLGDSAKPHAPEGPTHRGAGPVESMPQGVPTRQWTFPEGPEAIRGSRSPPHGRDMVPIEPHARDDKDAHSIEDIDHGVVDGVERGLLETRVGPNPTEVVRHPSITATGEHRPGATWLVRVDLTRSPDDTTIGGRFSFGDLIGDWRPFAVSVIATSPQLDFAGGTGEGTVLVRRDADSVACVIPAVVNPEGAQRIDITVTFSRDDRWVGTAQRTWTADVSDSEAPTIGAVHFAPGAVAPDLTIHIHRDAAEPDRLHWLLSPALKHRRVVDENLYGEKRLTRDPRAFVRSLFATAAGARPGEHVSIMYGIGQILWEAAPANVQAAYWKLREVLGDELSIQFLTDEPWIPWELMRPIRRGVEGTRLLAETHPVARGLLAYPDRVRPDLPARGKRLTISPSYLERRPPVPLLAHAQDESAILRERFHATTVAPATARSILGVLEDKHSEPIQLFHFAGHGARNGEAVFDSIALEDADLRVAQVRRPEVVLGERYKTFVIFNACEVGATGDVLGQVGGWAEAFAHRDFSGFLAPLWAVFDGHAKVAMEALLEAVLERKQPIGRALRDVRRAYGDLSATFLSYVYYGDVNARFA